MQRVILSLWWGSGACTPIIPIATADAELGEQRVAVQAEAVVQLLGRLTRGADAVLVLEEVLVLEDLHWADPDTG